MGSPHCLGRPNVRIRLLARWDNFRLGLWSVCIFLSHLSEPIREVEIRDQRLELVKRLSMMQIMARRTRRTYKKTAFTEGLQEHPNQEIRVRNEFLPLAAIRWRLSAAMTDRQPKLERLLTNCTHRSFHHLGNLFYWRLGF